MTDAVLFAYDGSDQAKAAIDVASRQLRHGREAVVVTVWQPLAALPFAGPGPAGADIEAGIETHAAEVAAEGVALARSAGFRATAIVVSGTPIWRAIADAAEEHDAGIVVMGSHGRTGIGYVLMGSVATAVARHAERPVLIVHPPGDDEDQADGS